MPEEDRNKLIGTKKCTIIIKVKDLKCDGLSVGSFSLWASRGGDYRACICKGQKHHESDDIYEGAGKLEVNLNFKEPGKCLPCKTKVVIEQNDREVSQHTQGIDLKLFNGEEQHVEMKPYGIGRGKATGTFQCYMMDDSSPSSAAQARPTQ